MEKQIEEMANDLAKICPDLVENYCGQINCVTHLTLSLSKIGYRKASEVAREIFAEVDKLAYRYLNDADYSGGDLIYDLTELKKKYESEGEK